MVEIDQGRCGPGDQERWSPWDQQWGGHAGRSCTVQTDHGWCGSCDQEWRGPWDQEWCGPWDQEWCGPWDQERCDP